MTTAPWAGFVTLVTESGSPSVSLSLARTLIVTGVCVAALAESSLAIGGWLQAETESVFVTSMSSTPQPVPWMPPIRA